MLRYLAATNQLARFQLTNAVTEEIVEQLKARAEKARTEMTAVENEIQSEMRRWEQLKGYQSARLELDELNQRFGPIKKTAEELQNDLRRQGASPASVIEPAALPAEPDTRAAPRYQWILPGAGVAFVLGVTLVIFGRTTIKAAV